MSNPLFDKLGGISNPQINNNAFGGSYSNLLTRAQQMAQSLPSNFNPQAIVESMLRNSQVSQEQVNQAMQIANQLMGRRQF